MKLIDGLNKNKTENSSFIQWALNIENEAKEIISLVEKYRENPPENILNKAKNFLIEIEKWKASCIEDRTGNAIQNSSQEIWNALYGAVFFTEDNQKLLSIMQLKGFGSAIDDETGQRRAKVATSVLRFLWPQEWGIVDWRVATMLGLLDKNQWDIDKSINEASRYTANECRNIYNIIDENAAIHFNKQFRAKSQEFPSEFPRAADVDMAVFGISLLVWPMG